jgi:Holliday junction resolvasome RuvABC DNA-binding subunit
MIGMLSGKLVEKDFTSCLLDVSGVGYEVSIPLSTPQDTFPSRISSESFPLPISFSST